MRLILTLLLTLLLPTLGNAQSRSAVIEKVAVSFAIPNPSASAVNQVVRLDRALTGTSLSCWARGGSVAALVLQLRQCTGAGATSCATIGGDVTLAAIDTTYLDATLTGSPWAADSYIEIDVVSLTTAPEAAFCHVRAISAQ
jgi:hypothetical protein